MADYDTIRIECGYWNLTNRMDGTYYQFFDDKKEIVAKGFDIAVEEIKINNSDSLNESGLLLKAMREYPIDSNRIKQQLQRFHVKQIKFMYDTVFLHRIEMVDKDDFIHKGRIVPYFDGDKVIIAVRYFNGKDY